MQFLQADHITPDRVGTRAFHLDHITNFSKDNYAYLYILLAEENRAVPYVVVYDYPPSFNPIMQRLKRDCPVHLVCFADGEDGITLQDASSAKECPCGFIDNEQEWRDYERDWSRRFWQNAGY